MPAKTGREYADRIDRAQADVWIGGKQVSGKISEHPAFKNLMHTQSLLYDLQHEPAKRDNMTYSSPLTGDRVGLSYLIPKTKDDLVKRRIMFQEWARESFGMLGRSPDYMNTAVMAFGAAAPVLGEYSDNIKNYYEFCREHDISLTHTFVQPQVDRSSLYLEMEKEPIAAQIIDKTKDGIVIQGARLLATQGATTDEIMVFPSGMNLFQFNGDNPLAYAFAIPNNTPGLKFICREGFDDGKSSEFDRPLSSRFEEVDTLVVFDKVTVPWNRVFVAGDSHMANRIYSETNFNEHAVHQVVSRQIVKTEYMLGLIETLVETINVREYQHVQEKIAEVIVALEAMKGFLLSAETNAKPNRWGTMTPDNQPLLAAMNYYPRLYPRMAEILQTLGASGLVTLPTEADFDSERRQDLDKYMKAANADAYDRVKLFRLAWDACMSSFGTRETQYERYFFGDPVRLAGRLCQGYDTSPYVNRIKDFLNKK
ncbi:MAG TPA: 4-hydroxyphenylacetate 3-monooxygenase, oxygenase component [Bacillales bacterium]|nr:4-hydroxyphenylacetate 3-monooxygenase, oxygenase component [Bacillales bacterium]